MFQLKKIFCGILLCCLINLVHGACIGGLTAIRTSSVGTSETCIKVLTTKANANTQKSNCQAETYAKARYKIIGFDHHEIITFIKNNGYTNEAFFIDGTDAGHEGSWTYDDGTLMPMGAPHWYYCPPAQPDGGTAQNCACLFTPDFYIHSCDCNKSFMAICQL